MSETVHLKGTPLNHVRANVKAALDRQGLAQRQLGQRMDALGFTAWSHGPTLRRFFRGTKNPDLDETIALALALSVALETLIITDPGPHWQTLYEGDPPEGEKVAISWVGVMEVGNLNLTINDVRSAICVARGSLHWERPDTYVDWQSWDGKAKPPPVVRPKSAAQAQRELADAVDRLASELSIEVPTGLDTMEAVRLLWAELRKRGANNGEA